MIKLQVKDKNGTSLTNKDSIKWFEIKTDYNGHNDPYFMLEPCGTIYNKCEEYVAWYIEEFNDNGCFMMPLCNYDRAELCRLHDISETANDEEFTEYVLEPLQEFTGKDYTIEEMIKYISGFEKV